MSASELTRDEQENVRIALRFLRSRAGGTWLGLAKALRVQERNLAHAGKGKGSVSAAIAFRVARLAGVGIDPLLAGEYPPAGTCPHCGQRTEPEPEPVEH